ncbi:MAG TPA: glycine zipper 2TM domain-containing protein [Mariprofundaceae bacterium]|nr:glycine zipper 2TM domain-containing protein [Mariprofundaceae bacterium]
MLIKRSKSMLPVFRFPLSGVLLLASALVLGACASQRGYVEEPAPAPEAAPAPRPSTQVYFYPKAGQSQEQQDRDRYECYLWAMQQTGFDPSQPNLAPHQRVTVTPVPAPGHDTAVGALTGAAIGAVVAEPGNKAGGAVVGAVAGAAIGAASDQARQEQAQRLQQSYDQADAARSARIEQQASEYRRAMAACLEGRGYSVNE